MNILPIQSNDTNYIEVVHIVPPSAEIGRSIGIDLSASAKNKLDNIQTSLDLKSNLNNPIFTGTLTAPTINASSSLQINGSSTATLYAPKPWVQCVVIQMGQFSPTRQLEE